MARLSKQQRLKLYRQRLDHARQWREDMGYDDLWYTLVDLYRGKHFPNTMTTEDRLAINVAFSTINVIYPSVSINHPKITLLANKPEDEDRATITEAVVNYWWKHHDFRNPFRLAVKDFLMIGHGWIKVGYKFVEREEEMPEHEAAQALEDAKAEADEYAAQNPHLAGETPSDEEIEANFVATKMVVVEDRPFMERVSPWDVFVDPEATSLDDAAWIAQRIVRTLNEVRADKRYNAAARRRVEPDSVSRTGSYADQQDKKRDPECDRVTVWEYYDLKHRTVCVFAEGSDDYLVDITKMPYAFGHPFEMLRNYEIPDEIYPIGDLEQLLPLQLELDKTRSQLMNHRRKLARKYLYKEEAFGPDGLSALESDEDNTMVPVVSDLPFDQILVPMPTDGGMDAQLYQYSDVIESDMDKVSGVNEYARGATPEMKRTATEAAIIQDAANARAADKLAVIENSVGKIARKLVQLGQQFLTGDQVARVVGANNAVLWVPYTYDDIMGEFDFDVEGGSTQPNNETQKRQTAVAMMQALGPLVGVVVDPMQLARHVLQDGFGVKNPNKFLMAPPPPPMPGDPNTPQPPGSPQPPQAGGEPGLNGNQLPPQDLEAAKQEAAQQQIAGVPPEILQQLAGQSGLSLRN